MTVPRLSVLMSVYNGQKYLAASIDSLLQQTFSDFELIIADDQSTDSTAEILAEYANKDSRIRIVKGPREGLGVVRNQLVAEAAAPLLAWLDADDLALPERFEKQVQFMDANPDVVASGTSVQIIDEDGDNIKLDIRTTKHDDIDSELIEYRSNGIYFPSSIMRSAALEKIDGFRPEFPVGCDTDMFIRISEVGRIANLPEVLLQYRWHAGGNSWAVPLWQRDRAMVTINQARARRGMESLHFEVEQDIKKKTPRAKIYDSWASQALAGKNYQTAAKHAKRAIRKNPFLARPWRTLALARFPMDADPGRGSLGKLAASGYRWSCFRMSTFCGLFSS